MTALAAQAAALLGVPVESERNISGGNLSRVVRLRLRDGGTAIAKTGPAPRIEAAMLRAIAAAGISVPDILAVSDDLLILAECRSGGSLQAAWPSLGRCVAGLHAATGDRYGWPTDYAFGAVVIDNRAEATWPEFWAGRRLRVHLTHIPATLARRLELLAARLADRLPAHPRPALLHGDLWSGNILAAGGTVTALIDPACYYGHTEVDLAMLSLFDHPSPEFEAAYRPREPGHDERQAIYQLWPALVHLRLFGGTYAGLVGRLLSRAG